MLVAFREYVFNILTAAVIVLLVAGCSAYMHGHTASAYQGRWLRISEEGQEHIPGDIRLEMERKLDSKLEMAIIAKGLPDYIYIIDTNGIRFLYADESRVYEYRRPSFSTKSRLIGTYAISKAELPEGYEPEVTDLKIEKLRVRAMKAISEYEPEKDYTYKVSKPSPQPKQEAILPLIGVLIGAPQSYTRYSGQSPTPDVCNCKGYAGPGGPCYSGPGGPAYDGPGGPAYAGPGGPCYDGPGGPMYDGPGGPMYSGPGGPMYDGPGGPCHDGPGGPCYAGPGGPCYAGPGGPCYSGPGGTGENCPSSCK